MVELVQLVGLERGVPVIIVHGTGEAESSYSSKSKQKTSIGDGKEKEGMKERGDEGSRKGPCAGRLRRRQGRAWASRRSRSSCSSSGTCCSESPNSEAVVRPGRRRREAPGQIHGRCATSARVGRRFHGAAATAVAMDLGPLSSIGGREVEAEDRDEKRRDVAAADGGRRKEIGAVVC